MKRREIEFTILKQSCRKASMEITNSVTNEPRGNDNGWQEMWGC